MRTIERKHLAHRTDHIKQIDTTTKSHVKSNRHAESTGDGYRGGWGARGGAARGGGELAGGPGELSVVAPAAPVPGGGPRPSANVGGGPHDPREPRCCARGSRRRPLAAPLWTRPPRCRAARTARGGAPGTTPSGTRPATSARCRRGAGAAPLARSALAATRTPARRGSTAATRDP
jgi:hypothetical protein